MTIIRANVYSPPSVNDQSQVLMEKWTVFELSNGDRHLCGHLINYTRDGRVSSKIMKHDGRECITNSGRKYTLVGAPGWHPDAQYVWGIWCRVNEIDPTTTKDVSTEFISQ